jgi:DNA or RNA helicases of superfamily II
MQITLRPYQLEAIEKIQHEIFEKGVKSTLLIASTGAGKSAILLAFSKQFHEATGKHVLIVTHRVAVILQTAQRYADYYKLRCGVYGDGNTPNGDEDIIMATIQTVHKQSALTKLGKIIC